MSWFDEQIKLRKQRDDENFLEACDELSEAVGAIRSNGTHESDISQASDAISAVLKYFRVKPRQIPDDIETVSEVLEYQLSPFGIMSRKVKLKKGWCRKERAAMISTLKDSGRMIALIPRDGVGYRYFDPVSEKYTKVTKKNVSNISEEATVYYKPFPQGRIGIAGLVRYIFGNLHFTSLLLYVLFLYLSTVTGVALVEVVDALFSKDAFFSEVFNWLGDAVVGPEDMETRKMVFGIFLGGLGIYTFFTIIFKAFWDYVYKRIEARIETDLQYHVSNAAMMRVLALPPSFFGRFSSGELYERVQYVNDLAAQIVEAVLTVGAGGLFSYVYVGEINNNAPQLVVPALITTLLMVGVSVSTIFLNMKRSKEIMYSQSKESGLTYAMISGIRKIRLAGAEKRAFARWARLHKVSAKHSYRPPLIVMLNPTIVLAITLIGNAVMYYIAVKSDIAVAEYYTFNAAYGILSSTISSLSMVAVTIANIKPTLEMAAPILDTMPEVTGDRRIVRSISGSVELNNVSFSYGENSPRILDDLTLKIRSGQYVAIVGETGCGKSTLMRLMLGFEKPDRGAVYYDGRDLQTLDVRSVRRRIGVVLQGGKLFSGNILSNITITAPGATLEDAWEAAEMAGMAEDIRRMPMGMETMISEGSGGISGGQKQRLLIARAIAAKPKILMFDEATSALDNITQNIVSRSLDKLKCTRIVIAHRLSTIKNCDRIVVISKGRIAEDGTYDDLMKKNGFFASLVKRQMLDVGSSAADPESDLKDETLSFGGEQVSLDGAGDREALMKEKVDELISQKQIQITMSQIKPHFVYNTLSTIQALIRIDPEKAFVTLEKFGTYLRQNVYSMKSQNRIPFKEELEHTKIYTGIEEIRFPRIKVEYDIDDDDFSVPALSVQPMVENAIRHGVRVRSEGSVKVITRRLSDCHEVRIIDNGKGFDVKKVMSMDDTHIGIKNVRDRIMTMCGGTLDIESELDKGTVVTIRIPLSGTEEE